MASTRYRRTQVYLDPDEHRRLRRLAAERGVSMTTIVREAVSRYVAEAEPSSSGAGLVARLREIADMPEADPHPDTSPWDLELGEGLWRQHEETIRIWEEHRAAEAEAEPE